MEAQTNSCGRICQVSGRFRVVDLSARFLSPRDNDTSSLRLVKDLCREGAMEGFKKKERLLRRLYHHKTTDFFIIIIITMPARRHDGDSVRDHEVEKPSLEIIASAFSHWLERPKALDTPEYLSPVARPDLCSML